MEENENKDNEISEKARDALYLMYERVPLKFKIDLNKWKYKRLLLNGLLFRNC